MTKNNVRIEPLVGSLVLMLLVGYLSQTSPPTWAALVIAVIALTLGAQMAVATVSTTSSSSTNDGSLNSRQRKARIMAPVVGTIAIALLTYATYTLLAFWHYFSLAGVGVAICGGIVAVFSGRVAFSARIRD